MRPRAGIDIDGVVYEWEAQARLLLSAWWGVDLPESDNYYAIREGLKARLGDETGLMADKWLFSDGHRYGLWDRGEEVPGATDALRRLSVSHDLVIITKRPRPAIPATWNWFAARNLYPTELIVIPPDADRSKGTVHCDWYIDDSPAVVEDLTTFHPGSKVYLFSRAWNQECPFGERVNGWDGLLKKVLRGYQ